MPIYEYICSECERCFSVLQKIGSSEKDTCCPECGSKDVRKKLSAFSCSAGGGALSSSSFPRFSGGG